MEIKAAKNSTLIYFPAFALDILKVVISSADNTLLSDKLFLFYSCLCVMKKLMPGK
jgi:hypothetical protein